MTRTSIPLDIAFIRHLHKCLQGGVDPNQVQLAAGQLNCIIERYAHDVSTQHQIEIERTPIPPDTFPLHKLESLLQLELIEEEDEL